MPSLLEEGLISPELVLVAPAEEAEEARAALPDVFEFYEWIQKLRELVDDETVDLIEDDRRGLVFFTSVVLLNAVVPLLLVILWHVLA
jgi:hypothetical protein